VPSKFPYRAARAGDRLLLVAPSGGGYGVASERDPQAIREDIADEVLSPERARALYGFEA
jgi:N-methylhydantoinase B